MKKITVFLLMLLLISSVAFGHVGNEYTIYDDVQYSEAKKDILALRALGVIPSQSGVNIYGPQDLLTKEELGYYSAQFLLEKNEEWTESDYTNKALELGIVSSKDGNATHSDVITAYFNEEALKSSDIKALIKDKEKKEITKEEFAILLSALIERKDNDGLLSKSAYINGPVGKIEEVKKETVTEGESAYDIYTLVIDGNEYQIGHHPKVEGGPVEIEKWEGKEIAKSWLLVSNEASSHHSVDGESHEEETSEVQITIDYLQVKEGSFDESEYAPVNKKAEQKDKNNDAEKNSFPWVLLVSVVVAVLLFVVVWKSRKK